MAQKRVAFATLGCKVNQYDTDAVTEQFIAAGHTLVDFQDMADVYVINTCTVTNVGDRKSRQMIRRANRRNPDAKVVVMGCLSQTSPDEIGQIPGVNLIVGTNERGSIVERITGLDINEKSSLVDDIFAIRDFEELPVTAFPGKTRAMLKIQDGCNNFCTYCRVPFARGRSRSRQVDQVISEAQKIVAQGYGEIVLTGVHLGGYGADLDPSLHLTDIVAQLADLDGIKRVRISSIDPNEITPEFLELVANNSQVCKHLHIPLQSGCDTILHRMRRKYSTADYRHIVNKARQLVPDLAITTDIIVGFPGESEQEFTETYQFVKEMNFSRLHVFKYSKRDGTVAARYSDQVSHANKDQRSRELIELGEQMGLAYYEQYLNKDIMVLVEDNKVGYATGLTSNYIKVDFPVEPGIDLVGKEVLVRATEANITGISGIAVNEEREV